MSNNESDDDLLADLLANDDDANTDNDAVEDPPTKKFKANVLKELDFLSDAAHNDDLDKDLEVEEDKNSNRNTISCTQINDGSSDDEDRRDFENQRYSEYGRDVKNLLKTDESVTQNYRLESGFKNRSFNESSNNILKNKSDSPKRYSFQMTNSSSPSKEENFSGLLEKCETKPQYKSKTLARAPRDVHSDPVFGLRLVKPLISSAELLERMQGRTAVTVSRIKLQLTKQAIQNSSLEDWVIAGVIISKSSTKTSQKGNQYCIWKISDLGLDMKTVSIFLFGSAYKNFWKIARGVAIGILNPAVLESKDDKDLATLSCDNAQKIMILGNSRDLGVCKSAKKNGEPCTAPVNLSRCEYCIYHVKQEYGKFSRRSDLQSNSFSKRFGLPENNANNTKNSYMQQYPQRSNFIGIPAKRNEAQYKKDCERLALLRGQASSLTTTCNDITLPVQKAEEQKMKGARVDLSSNQMKKDFERLNKLRRWNDSKNAISPPVKEESIKSEKASNISLNLSIPKLGSGARGGFIDFSDPVPKTHMNRAKQAALEWVKRKGGIQKSNPNAIHPDKAVLNEKGIKRKRNEETEKIIEKKKEKEDSLKAKFKEMLEMKSAHTDLIEKREDEEADKYFNKLEIKERMEEKMLNTFKVDCKAVRCNVCKYIAFSSSDMCKKLQHPIKVIDAVKRFFKCGNCGNRTICLDRHPLESCKKCSSSKWMRTAMMDERKTKIPGTQLCIRGGEETFVGSLATAANLDLLVPES